MNPVFSPPAQGVSFSFVCEAKGKAHCHPFKCFNCCGPSSVSTCVTKSSDVFGLSQDVTYSKDPTVPLGRKGVLTCLLAGRQSRVGEKKKYISSQRARMPTTPSATLTCVTDLQIPRKEEERGVWELHVYMCFELCLTHNWKAINLQRPQKYFYSNNKCTLFVGLFQMAQTRSPQRWYAVLIGSRGEVGWGGGIIFFSHLS